MCPLIENALLNLLNVPLNYLSMHSLPNCLYVDSDVFTPLMLYVVCACKSMRNMTCKNALLKNILYSILTLKSMPRTAIKS